MESDGAAFVDALQEAQRLGYAERDPSNDVKGFDTCRKLAILLSLAMGSHADYRDIYTEGIDGVNQKNFAYAKALGCTIRLIASARKVSVHGVESVFASVAPSLVPLSHPLASVNGSLNAVYLYGHACGELMLYGRGAGDAPTASAVVSDMLAAARTDCSNASAAYRMTSAVEMDTDWESRYFIRLQAVDQPGVLGAIAGILGRHGVSIASMRQTTGEGRAPLLFVTHMAREKDVRAALSEIDESLATIENVIYVEEGL
jgi:homoserine dehydrogenase